jgi:phosphate transport system substrate-binding protein
MRTACALLLCGLLFVACGKGQQGRTMIQNKGSDTMVNLAQAWAEEYRAVRPGVAIAVTGGGTGTGIAALINGTVDIANASRELKKEELESARKGTGKTPVEHVVAYDAIAIYVHRDNPIKSIAKKDLACIYGEKGTCAKWTDLGVEVPGCAGQEIVRVGRQNNSGTYAYFREWVLGEKEDFKLGSRDMQGSKDVVDLVEHTPCAIGYSGMGYRTPGVRTICVARDDGTCVEPAVESAVNGTYPIARGLYMYTMGEATGPIAEYLSWIKSDAAQQVVATAGYAPVPKERRATTP